MQQTAYDLFYGRASESESIACKKQEGTKIGRRNRNCSRNAEGAPSLSDISGTTPVSTMVK